MTASKIIIALDAMGGDAAPDIVVHGAALALAQFPHVHYLIYGRKEVVKPLLTQYSLTENSTFFHTDEVVTSHDKPSTALRSGRNSSMGLAIQAVKEGKAAGVVSAGNTGAYMAMARFIIGPLVGVDRPAIASVMPNQKGGKLVMLDLGANVECRPENLIQFALMGQVFANQALNLQKPTVGLLNVGAEELKGSTVVKLAAEALKKASNIVNYYGFVEGDDIAAGTVDVIVADGFSGNVALKTVEGVVRMLTVLTKKAFKDSWLAKIGYLLARPALKSLHQTIDPRLYNGAIFLGLNGVAVKSHGGTDAVGFASAIGVTINMASHDFKKAIEDGLADLMSQDQPQ